MRIRRARQSGFALIELLGVLILLGAVALVAGRLFRTIMQITYETPARQDAVTSFYTRAAQKDFSGAWALGTDRLHSQLGSLASFTAQEQSLQSISFPQLRTTSQTAGAATLAFASIARHSDRTDNCHGQVATVRGAGGWMVDYLDAVTCVHQPNGSAGAATPAPAGGPGQKPGKGANGPKEKGRGKGGGD